MRKQGAVHQNFNPRSREGSDDLDKILTHSTEYFNPRSREGSDRGRERMQHKKERFQSTLP